MKRENISDKKRKSAPQGVFSTIVRHLTRQVIAAAIFFSIVYAMHSSSNMNFSDYASSLGRALRYDCQFEQNIKSGAEWLREYFSPNKYQGTEGITFQ